MRPSLVAFGVVLLSFGSTALSHESATGIVKQRMDDMKAMGRALKRAQQQSQSKRVAEVAAEGETIAATAVRILSLFPAGSKGDHSEAAAAIWDWWTDFEAASRSLTSASEALTVAARSGQPSDVAGQLRAVSQACSGCHDAFRVRH